MFTSTKRTVNNPCRRKLDRHASVLSQKLLMTGPAHRQINSKFIDSYADILYQLSHQGSLISSVGKESACNAGDPGLISGLGISPGERIGYPLQYSGLENSMDCIVNCKVSERIAESDTTEPLSLSPVDIIKDKKVLTDKFSTCVKLMNE